MATRYSVVSVDGSPDKLALFEEQAKFYNLKYNLFCDNTSWKAHIFALLDFMKSTDDYCVILETGVVISCNLQNEIERFINTTNEKWGVCWLGLTLNHHNNSTRPQPVLEEYNDVVMKISYPLGFFGYIITREAAGHMFKCSDKNPYDVNLMEACNNLGYPKLALKNPVVHLNVWLDDVDTINLYESVDLALYRRDYEISFLENNPKLRVYAPNLLVGAPREDLSLKEIEEILNEFYETENPKILNALKTWKQKIVTVIENEEDYYGRALFYLRHIPVTAYVKNGVNLGKIPIFPLMKLKYGKPQIKPNDLFVKLTQYHFIPRDTFSKYWFNTNWVGFQCGKEFIQNYFYSGDRSLIHRGEDIKVYGGDNKLMYHLYREAEEHLNLVEKFALATLANDNGYKTLAARLNAEIEEEVNKKPIESKRYTAAFINADFAKNHLKESVEYVDPNTYPDFLFSLGDCNFPAKKHIVFSQSPEEISTLSKTVISSYKHPKYHWFPNFFWLGVDEIERVRNNQTNDRSKFCVVTSFKQNEKEDSMKEFLDKFKNVDSAGPYNPNCEIIQLTFSEMLQLYSQYNFVLICDDPIIPGMISMKFIVALMAGCIPIYLGPPEVDLFFNPNCYINFHHFKTIEEFIIKIRYSELNNKRSEFLSQSMFTPKVSEMASAFTKFFTY